MEQDIRGRVAELRKKLGLTQGKFGKELGITASALSAIEKRKALLTEAKIKLICRVFSVSEDWLRNGRGDMFQAGKAESFLSFKEKEILGVFRRLTESMKEIFLQIGRDMVSAENLKKIEAGDSVPTVDTAIALPEPPEKREVG
jgi:transcriptional regulator with XRE-family HTH domain